MKNPNGPSIEHQEDWADAHRTALEINERIQKSKAMQATWWVNLYPNGQISSTLCKTREEALNRCTWTNDGPDAIQIKILLSPIL